MGVYDTGLLGVSNCMVVCGVYLQSVGNCTGECDVDLLEMGIVTVV
jgi:hypothetical protein